MNEQRWPFNFDFSKIDLRNEDDFLSVYDFFAPRLMRHAMVRLKNPDEAKDVVSQVFLKAWEYVTDTSEENRSVKNVKAFLYQIANNQIIDTYRKKSRTEISLESLPSPEEVGGTSDALRRKSDSIFDARVILSFMDAVRPEYKEILVWRYIDDLDIGEIASVSGKSKGAISVMLYRALSDIKRLAKEKGL